MWYFTARDACNKYRRSANELTDIRFHPCGITQPVSDAAYYTRHRIDFFSENQGDLIDKDITNHTSCGTCDTTHDDGYPKRIAQSDTFPHTDHRKQSQSDGIEYKKVLFRRISQRPKQITQIKASPVQIK